MLPSYSPSVPLSHLVVACVCDAYEIGCWHGCGWVVTLDGKMVDNESDKLSVLLLEC